MGRVRPRGVLIDLEQPVQLGEVFHAVGTGGPVVGRAECGAAGAVERGRVHFAFEVKDGRDEVELAVCVVLGVGRRRLGGVALSLGFRLRLRLRLRLGGRRGRRLRLVASRLA